MSDLPIIDVSALFQEGPHHAIDRLVGKSLEKAGGFVVTGFPGAAELEDRAARMLSFFQLPQQDRASARSASGLYRGYISLLGIDDFARTEWFDTGPVEFRTAPPIRGSELLVEPNGWPTTEPYDGWRKDVESHFADLEKAALAVMFSVARACNADSDDLKTAFREGNSTLRLLHYPAPEVEASSDGELRLAAVRHTDAAGVSLLWQAGPGLQVEGLDGVWRDVPQLPGSISVHLGDVLEMMTGGRVPPTPHRVVDHGGERHSIGFFLEPSLEASMTGTDRLQDTYAWRLLERLRGYPSLAGQIPEPAPL